MGFAINLHHRSSYARPLPLSLRPLLGLDDLGLKGFLEDVGEVLQKRGNREADDVVAIALEPRDQRGPMPWMAYAPALSIVSPVAT